MPPTVKMTHRQVSDFAVALDALGTRWRKTPPARIEWYRPPRRSTLPALRYSVNPAKTMILKVMISPLNPENHRPISVALFQIDGRFMFDKSFSLDDTGKAMTWLRRLLTDKSVVGVEEKNGRWQGLRVDHSMRASAPRSGPLRLLVLGSEHTTHHKIRLARDSAALEHEVGALLNVVRCVWS